MIYASANQSNNAEDKTRRYSNSRRSSLLLSYKPTPLHKKRGRQEIAGQLKDFFNPYKRLTAGTCDSIINVLNAIFQLGYERTSPEKIPGSGTGNLKRFIVI